ncbi:27537_t:CDS:1, partial [Gigaspora margarita]
FCKKRTHILLTNNEKWMVINIHRHLFGDISITKQKQNFTLRKQVVLVSNISESTVEAILPTWNKQNDGTFLSNQKIGWPKLGLNKDIKWLNTY